MQNLNQRFAENLSTIPRPNQKEEELKRAHEGAFAGDGGPTEGALSASSSYWPAAASGPGGDPPPPPGYPEDKYKGPEKNGRTNIVVNGRTIGHPGLGPWRSFSHSGFGPLRIHDDSICISSHPSGIPTTVKAPGCDM